MANDGPIAKDTLFGPERLAVRAIDWDQSDRGLSSGRAAIMLQSRRRIHGRSRNHASITRNALAPREPSIHGSSTMANALKRRGSLTIWFDPGMIWAAKPTGKRGRQPVCSDAAVQTCLTMKVLFGMVDI